MKECGGGAHCTYERTDALEGTRADAHLDAEHAGDSEATRRGRIHRRSITCSAKHHKRLQLYGSPARPCTSGGRLHDYKVLFSVFGAREQVTECLDSVWICGIILAQVYFTVCMSVAYLSVL